MSQALGIGLAVESGSAAESSQLDPSSGASSMELDGALADERASSVASSAPAGDDRFQSVYEAIELDADSTSVVYFALLRLMDVLIEEFSVSAERRGGPPSALRQGEEPRWVNYLAGILENTALPVASRTLAARLVLSRSSALKAFSTRLLAPMLAVGAETLPRPRRHSSDKDDLQRASELRQQT